MAVQFGSALRNARLDAIGTILGASGTLTVYSGSPTGVGNAAPTGLLVTLTAVTYAAASGGTKTFSATAATAAGSGTPAAARLLTSGGTAHAEFDAGVGSGTLNFNSAISSGGTVSLTSATFTEGNP